MGSPCNLLTTPVRKGPRTRTDTVNGCATLQKDYRNAFLFRIILTTWEFCICHHSATSIPKELNTEYQRSWKRAGEIYWCYILIAQSSITDFLTVFALWELVSKKKNVPKHSKCPSVFVIYNSLNFSKANKDWQTHAWRDLSKAH